MRRRAVLAAIAIAMVFVVWLPAPAPAPAGTWEARAPMPTDRGGFGVAELNGTIYVAGGLRRAGFSLNLTDVLEVYDPARDNWTSAAPLPAPRWGHVLVASRGKLFMAGGSTDVVANSGMTPEVDMYDPGIDRWAPVAPLPQPRMWPMGFALSNTVQVWGGSPDGGSTAVSTRYSYDPSSNLWTIEQPMPMALTNAAAVAIAPSVYVTGGWRNLPNVTEYRSATDTWTDLAQMLKGRGAHAAAELNGEVVAISGVTADTTECAPSATVEVYSPANGTWRRIADYPQPAEALGAVTIGTTLYAMGGMVCSASYAAMYALSAPAPPPPGPAAGFPWLLVAVIVLVAVLVAVLAFALWRSRRKSPPPAT